MQYPGRNRSGWRAGFTMVELLTVMALIGILVGIAVPHYQGLKKRAFAASIFADVHAIRVAAMSYYTESGKFPAEAPDGQVPPEIVNHLPNGFEFSRPEYDYDWEIWNTGGTTDLVGVKVSSGDTELIAHLFKAGGSNFIPIASASSVTFLLATK